MVCQAPLCNDVAKNGTETDVDCGGATCAKCGPTKGCKVDGDCVGGSCNGATCNVTCTDLVLNNGESDVDCGGANCQVRQRQGVHGGSDCTSLSCSPGNICLAPTCSDNIKNQGESDVDCGGANCADCGTNKVCVVDGDCVSAHCVGNLCAAPTCNDGVKNQGESDTDCGGLNCNDCVDGKTCVLNDDCVSVHCVGLVCVAPTCIDGIKNQNETDVDCSGPCPTKCGPNKTCTADRLHRRVCGATPARPTAPTVKNNVETDVDCGGGTCGAARWARSAWQAGCTPTCTANVARCRNPWPTSSTRNPYPHQVTRHHCHLKRTSSTRSSPRPRPPRLRHPTSTRRPHHASAGPSPTTPPLGFGVSSCMNPLHPPPSPPGERTLTSSLSDLPAGNQARASAVGGPRGTTKAPTSAHDGPISAAPRDAESGMVDVCATARR